MSLINSPNVVTDSLTFLIDNNSIKSYSGPAVKNVATTITPQGQSISATYKFSSGTENVYVPTLGWIDSAYMDMYNDYNGGSGSCCPSPFTYGNSLAVSGSTVYTYAIVYKSINRYTHPNFMYHYEYNGGTYITEYGVHMVGGYSGQETHLGDDWYWSRSKFTTNASCNSLNTGCWMYEYARYNRLYIAKVLIAPGDWTSMHPRNWPALGTTPSSTQIITSSTLSNVTVTASNLSYNTDGSYSFNGSSSYLDLSTTQLVGSAAGTVSAVIKIPSAQTDYNCIFSCETGADWNNLRTWLSMYGANQIRFTVSSGSASTQNGCVSTALSYNTTYHVVGTYDGANLKIYINGVLNTTYSSSIVPGTFTPTLVRIGHHYSTRYFNGTIYSLKTYNKALSAEEVYRDFNAQRGRYGL